MTLYFIITYEHLEKAKDEPIYFIVYFIFVMTRVTKVIELVGSSDKGWTEAAQAAVDEAKKTIKEITGLDNCKCRSEYRNNEKIKSGSENCVWRRGLSSLLFCRRFPKSSKTPKIIFSFFF